MFLASGLSVRLMAYTSYHNMKLYIPSRDRDVARQLREELEARLIASGDDDDMQGSGASPEVANTFAVELRRWAD